MGLRFRKSIGLGHGFRINISKSGVGYSWGGREVFESLKRPLEESEKHTVYMEQEFCM